MRAYIVRAPSWLLVRLTMSYQAASIVIQKNARMFIVRHGLQQARFAALVVQRSMRRNTRIGSMQLGRPALSRPGSRKLSGDAAKSLAAVSPALAQFAARRRSGGQRLDSYVSSYGRDSLLSPGSRTRSDQRRQLESVEEHREGWRCTTARCG